MKEILVLAPSHRHVYLLISNIYMVTITTILSRRHCTSFVRPLTKLFLISFSCLLLCLAQTQAQEDQELLTKGSNAFDSGRYQESIQALSTFLDKFKDHRQVPLARYLIGIAHYTEGNYKEAIPYLTDSTVEDKEFPDDVKQSAIFHLGASNYFLGRYEPAIAAFKSAAYPPVDPEDAKKAAEKKATPAQDEAKAEEPSEEDSIRSYALFYLGRAQMEYGSKLNEELKKPDEAKKAWLAGLKAINDMATNFPNSPLISDALMTRGTLQVYAGMFAEAEADLRKLKASPEGAEMAAEADYLLGFVLTQQAVQLLGDFKEDEAKAVTQKAREIYLNLSKNDNLVVANEAAFQLANLDFTDKNYAAAIEAYRALKSKDALIASQQARLDKLRRQVPGGDIRKLAQIQRAIKREEQKLAAVKANPELANEAWIKIGESYMQMREYNKARVVYRHATQFAEEDQKKRLEVQVIISHAAQGNADKADQLFVEFRKKYPNDELAQSVKFLLGTAFMQQERYDEALKAFDESLKEFPESPNSAQIPKLRAQILAMQGKKDEAIQSFRDFIKDAESKKIKVAPAVIEDTKRLLAITLYGEKKYDESVSILTDLAANATTPTIKEEVSFQLANILAQLNKTDEAIEQFKSFSENFPDAANAPRAAYQQASLLEQQKKIDEARSVFESIITRFPNTEIALFSYDKIWRSYGDDLEQVIPAQEKMIAAYPNSDRSLGALFDRAKIYDKKLKDSDKAIETYQNLLDRYQSISESERTEKMDLFASYSLVTTALIKQKLATTLGEYKSLDDASKQEWADLIKESGEILKRVVKEFPGSKAANVAISKWVDVLLNRVGNGLIPMDQALTEMSTLAGEMPNEAAKLQVMIAQAGMLNKTGQRGQALRIYEQAFSQVSDMKNVSWQDLSNYGDLLLEDQKWQQALEIFQKLDSNTTDENKHAKADATYGQGAALQGLGKSAEAQKFFDTLQEKFAWSPKIMEARYGSAFAKFEAGQLQETIDIVKEIISSRNSSNASKAKSMILMARALQGMGDSGQTTPETKQQDGEDMSPYDLACNYLAKVEVFYADALPLYSSEALYRAIAIRKKQNKNQEAQEMLERLLSDYSTTPWGQKARKDY